MEPFEKLREPFFPKENGSFAQIYLPQNTLLFFSTMVYFMGWVL
jgi:hypothetical protein